MDLHEASEERFKAGVDRFAEGHALTYGGVVFSREPAGWLTVQSFSNAIRLENATPAEAHAAIERSRAALEAMTDLSDTFAHIADQARVRFVFCLDTGTVGIPLAIVEDDRFNWLGAGS